MKKTKCKLGGTPEAITEAEKVLGFIFPQALHEIWLTVNGFEMKGGWILYHVHDPDTHHRRLQHVVYENTMNRWEIMPDDLLAIGDNDSGDHMVLKKGKNGLGTDIYIWDHATNETKKMGMRLADLLEQAREFAEKKVSPTPKSKKK